MYIILTVPLLVFFNVLTVIAYSQEIPLEKIKSRMLIQHNDNCVCFPGGESIIPELQNAEANGLERLVMYLYRNVNTNQINVFIPQTEKQTLIPNIPVTQGDTFKPVTIETIAQLFKNNPAVVQTQSFVNTQGEPIGLNFGLINKGNPDGNFNRENVPSFLNNVDQYLPKRRNLNQQHPGHQQNYLGYQDYVYPHKVRPQTSSLNSNVAVYPTDTNEINNPYKKSVINNGPNAVKPEDNYYINPINPYQNKLVLEPVNPNLPVNNNIYNEESVSNQFTSFDVWFERQVQAFQSLGSPRNLKTNDIYSLKSVVEKALLDNHMHISVTGTMTDENGFLINFRNVQLRRILIGGALTPESAQQLMYPHMSPYLEGILIALVYPPKILGFIPLGKTYLSSGTKTVKDLSSTVQDNSPIIKYYYTESTPSHGTKLTQGHDYGYNSLKPHQSGNSNLNLPTISVEENKELFATQINSAPNPQPNLDYSFPTKTPLYDNFSPVPTSNREQYSYPNNAPYVSSDPYSIDVPPDNEQVSPVSPIHNVGSNSQLGQYQAPNNKNYLNRYSNNHHSTVAQNDGKPDSLNINNFKDISKMSPHWTPYSTWVDEDVNSVHATVDSGTSGSEMGYSSNFDGIQYPDIHADVNSIQNNELPTPSGRYSTPGIPGFLKSLFQMVVTQYSDKKSPEGNNQTQKKGDKTVTNVKVNHTRGNPIKKPEEIQEDDLPGFRIIGGQAGTGSGAPISNRGRSGIM